MISLVNGLSCQFNCRSGWWYWEAT